MEKVEGIELDQVWSTMDVVDRFTVVKHIASFQNKWASISLNKYGSLYFPEDLLGPQRDCLTYTDEQGCEHTSTEFAMGPSTARENNDDGRGSVEFDLGPCKS